MGRKKIDEPRESFTSMLKPDQIKEIRRLAEKVDGTPSQMAASLIDMGLDIAHLLENSGLLRVGIISREISRMITRKIDREEEIILDDIKE